MFNESSDLLDGLLSYIPKYLSSEESDTLLTLLFNRTHWQEEYIRVYGNRHKIPRLQCWVGASNFRYQYSGKSITASIWPQNIRDLAHKIEETAQTKFNSTLINLYRNGNDCMGWHSDNEPELGQTPTIASLTLGAERDFALRKVGETKQHSKLRLEHGSLLIMRSGMQTLWQHAVPKRAGINSPRINLTFRYMVN